MACVPDDGDERAVKEVAQVYERIKIQQPLIQCSSFPPSATTQLAQSLLGDALRALNVALSVMQQQQPAVVSVAGAVTPAGIKAATTSTARTGKRKRSSVMEGQNSSSRRVNFTFAPYEDGYEWRKYGEKSINGTSYTRSYFRCTYKDDKGCMATKHIQQKDSSDPPLFQVTYNNEHTCNIITSSPAANKINTNDNHRRLPFPPGYYNNNLRNDGGGHAAAMVEQQQPQQLCLPPLADVPLDHHQTSTFQEPPPFPVPANHHVPLVHADTVAPAEDMDMEPAAGDNNYDDPLRDLEFFLMHDNDDGFNY